MTEQAANEHQTPGPNDEVDDLELARYRQPGRYWVAIAFGGTVFSILLAINEIFRLPLFKWVLGNTLLQNQYLYLIVGVMTAMMFIFLPATKNAPRDRVPLYDIALIVAVLGLTIMFAWLGIVILEDGWEYNAPDYSKWYALVFWFIILEAGRRAGGWAVFFIATLISFFPVYVHLMPEVISGVNQSLFDTAAFHVFSEESLLGIPIRAYALLFFGFMIFGNALVYTGGGRFFLDLAFAVLGHVRGGPAKVAIFSSGLFGSISGGPITNVLTTGALTIPTMTRIGVRPKTAGAIEACASTGGTMMPPIMGATAFVMADFLGMSYISIAAAAVIPSLLYYLGLFVQIDAYSANHGLKGLPREELPKVGQVFKEGWYYLAVFALLIFLLVYMKREAQAPFLAAALLLIINQFNKTHRMSWATFKKFVYATGGLLAELAGLLAAVGMIVGALQATGMTGTLTNDLVFLAGGSPLMLLIMGAVTSFILGIGMTVTAAYIFLAIILAPALISVGLDPLSVHMFLLYWGMLSFITPPVALAAFAAASISKAGPMETGLEAMRIGTIIYFIPFFFVFNPALLLQGSVAEIAMVFVTALFGITLVAAGLQGWLFGFGSLGRGMIAVAGRSSLVVGGLVLAAPGGGTLGISHGALAAIAIVLALPGFCIAWLNGRSTSSAVE